MTIADRAVPVTQGQPRHRAGAGRRSAQQRRQPRVRRDAPALAYPDGCVTPLTLDMTNAA
jgi:hypothetical protein